MNKELTLVIAMSIAMVGCSSTDPELTKEIKNSKTEDNFLQTNEGFFAYYTKTSGPQTIKDMTGPYADIVVNIENKGNLIFSAETSYLPVWHFENENTNDKQAFNNLIEPLINSDSRFDSNNDFSYARIIEQTPEKITVHWRYMPVPDAKLQSDPKAVVHELITIKADGEVTRLHRPGTDTIDQWKALSGAVQQTLSLTTNGLANVQSQAALQTSIASKIPSSIITKSNVGNPVAHWHLDEGVGKTVSDQLSNTIGQLDSHGGDWVPGVSGHGLSFDGYRSKVTVNPDNLPDLNNAFTVEAWIFLSAYPWGDAPILHQTQAQGLYFGVTGAGALTLKLAGSTLSSSQSIPTNQWLHVSASVGDQMTIYVNGQALSSSATPNNLTLTKSELMMGLNSQPSAAIEGVRIDEVDEFNHFSSIFGLEAVIDEVVIHDRALRDAEVLASYEHIASNLSSIESPNKRQLPNLEEFPQSFGAYHTQLDFHDMWDNLWRVTEIEDIVVRFDDKPLSLVYWRGTSHGMNLVTEDYWMSDQSVEMIIPDLDDPENTAAFNEIVTLAEHMSDKTALRTHVRLIENSPARVKVHWRYAAADVFGTLIMDNAFIDEVHTIYPDGIAIRDVYYHGAENKDDPQHPGVVFYQDFQWLLSPGQKPEDFMNRTAVSLAELSGTQKDVFYPYNYQTDLEGSDIPETGNIAVLNSKTKWKVFGISQGNTFYPSSNIERSPHVDFEGQTFPFAGPWNHWPVAQIPSDGRYTIQYDRVSHFALGVLEAFQYGTGSMMYGFVESQTNELGDPTKLQSLAKSWVTPAVATTTQGVKNNEVTYNKNERAFHLTSNGGDIELVFSANESQPLKNPAFVIHQWNSNTLPEVLLNNITVTDVKMGIERDTDGSQMLVIFLPQEHSSQTTFSFKKT